MGAAAAVLAAVGVAGAIGSYNSAKSQARLVEKEGAIKAAERAEDIRKLAAKQRVAYVSAGLELEGTPQNVMADTYNTGIADVLSIGASYHQQAKNIKKQATAQLLGSLASAGVSAFSGSASAGTTSGTGLNASQLDYYNQNSSGGFGVSGGWGGK